MFFQIRVYIHTPVAVEEYSVSLRRNWRRSHRGNSKMKVKRKLRKDGTKEQLSAVIPVLSVCM